MDCPLDSHHQKAFSRVTLKKRSDFLKTAQKGLKAVTPSLILQFYFKQEPSKTPVRFGFTATRKIGSSVVRNRARRRLRAVVDQIAKNEPLKSGDYVLIARQGTPFVSFETLIRDFKKALKYAA